MIQCFVVLGPKGKGPSLISEPRDTDNNRCGRAPTYPVQGTGSHHQHSSQSSPIQPKQNKQAENLKR